MDAPCWSCSAAPAANFKGSHIAAGMSLPFRIPEIKDQSPGKIRFFFFYGYSFGVVILRSSFSLKLRARRLDLPSHAFFSGRKPSRERSLSQVLR